MSELVPFWVCDVCSYSARKQGAHYDFREFLNGKENLICVGTLQPAFMLADLEKEIEHLQKMEGSPAGTDQRDPEGYAAGRIYTTLKTLLNTLRKARK